ncbi:hypothetical protein JCM11251_007146 [Rhodosporidiobolus azoricus]
MRITLIALIGYAAFPGSFAGATLQAGEYRPLAATSEAHRLSIRAKAPSSVVCKNGFHYTPDRSSCICPSTKYISLDGDKCLSFCSSGSYIQQGTQQCQACPDGWARRRNTEWQAHDDNSKDGRFLHDGDCLSSCPAGTWTDDAPGKNRCRPCACSDAVSCTDSKQWSATACATKYLYEGECLDEEDLPDGVWADEETHTAIPCDPHTTACTGNGRGTALACGKDNKGDQYFLRPQGDCKLHCPYGWFGSKADGMCYPCDETMETCNANGAILCAKASSEPSGRLNKTPDRRCIPSGSTLDGYYLNSTSGTYEPCGDGVATCSGTGEESALSCGIALNGTQLFMHTERWMQRRRLKRKITTRMRPSPSIGSNGLHIYHDCVQAKACEAGTFPNATTAQCEECNLYAATCDAEKRDLSWSVLSIFMTLDEFWSYRNETGLYCVPDTKCKELGAYYAGPDYTCLPCADGVTECTGPTYQDARACGIASNGTQLIYSQTESSCGLSCPSGTYLNEEYHECYGCGWPDRVATCEDDQTATSCNSGYFLSSTECVQYGECPEGSFENYDNSTCDFCSTRFDGSRTCTYDAALTCQPSYLLVEGDNPYCAQE